MAPCHGRGGLREDKVYLQVVSRQFTDRFFDHFTDRALGIRAEEDNFLLFLTLDIDPSPSLKFGPSPWSQNESE